MAEKTNNNLETFRILIDGMHCGNCAMNVENHLNAVEGVEKASVSLASNSGTIVFDTSRTSREEIMKVFDELSFDGRIVESDNRAKILEERACREKAEFKRNITMFVFSAGVTIFVVVVCMVGNLHMQLGHALAGLLGLGSLDAASSSFGSYIASLSGDMPFEHTLHMWLSNVLVMILTIPVQFVVGARFYKGAVDSIKSKMANMDVLVALGTTIAFLFSVYITFFDMNINGGMPYFETCDMLITFVLLGKLLEARAKGSAGAAVEKLIRLTPDQVTVLKSGKETECALADVFPGDMIVVKRGDNFPVDGAVMSDSATVDESMLTGEADLIEKLKGDRVYAGTKNLEGKVLIKADSVGQDTQLSHIIETVEQAEMAKPSIQRLADKIASIFVPTIILFSVITFFGWIVFSVATGAAESGEIIKSALLPAIAVICVACPCALGLATPTAVMVGMGKGAEKGILIKDGEMLERACKIDTVVFDKTGTLTRGVVDEKEDSSIEVKGDTIKEDARASIEELRANSIACWMVTGDKHQRALEIAGSVGIDEKCIVDEVLPTEKGDALDDIRAKSAESSLIAFVGDGINDAPALAKADVAIAMSSGSDIAIDAGGVVLMHNKVGDVFGCIKLSSAVMRKIKQNLFWALIYNCIMIPLAAFGILAPALSGFAMAMSSVCVVCNSLLLKRFK